MLKAFATHNILVMSNLSEILITVSAVNCTILGKPKMHVWYLFVIKVVT